MGNFAKDDYAGLPNIERIIENEGMLIIYLLPESVPVKGHGLRQRYKAEAELLIAA